MLRIGATRKPLLAILSIMLSRLQARVPFLQLLRRSQYRYFCASISNGNPSKNSGSPSVNGANRALDPASISASISEAISQALTFSGQPPNMGRNKPNHYSKEKDNMQDTTFPTDAEQLRSSLKENISRARQMYNKGLILKCITTARLQNVRLDTKEYMSGLWACTEVNDSRNEEAYWIYEKLREQKLVPIDAFNRVMKVCSLRGDAEFALELHEEFQRLNYVVNEQFLTDFVVALAKHPRSDRFHNEIDKLMSSFRMHASQRGWKMSGPLMEEVAKHYSRMGRGKNVVRMLRQMTASEIEPSSAFCNEILNSSLENRDTKVCTIIGNWFLKVFPDPLSKGTLRYMLLTASMAPNPELARLAVHLHVKYGFPVTPDVIYCWALTCLRAADVLPTIEALVESQLRNIDLYASTEFVSDGSQSSGQNKITLGEHLRDQLADRLATNTHRQDEFYYALVDLVRNNVKVPKLLLDSVVMASALMGQQDKAFATFQEYQSLFQVTPDVHSYNGLLQALAITKWTSMHDLLKILQSMEQDGCEANDCSFTILLEYIAERRDFSVVEHLLNIVKSKNFKPTGRAYRRLYRALVQDGQTALAAMVDEMSQRRLESMNQPPTLVDGIQGPGRIYAKVKGALDNEMRAKEVVPDRNTREPRKTSFNKDDSSVTESSYEEDDDEDEEGDAKQI